VIREVLEELSGRGIVIRCGHWLVAGRPQVLLMLERVFDYISKHAGVKFCTFDEIADDFRQRHPRQGAAAQAAHAG
jgi:hypothetical protein